MPSPAVSSLNSQYLHDRHQLQQRVGRRVHPNELHLNDLIKIVTPILPLNIQTLFKQKCIALRDCINFAEFQKNTFDIFDMLKTLC